MPKSKSTPVHDYGDDAGPRATSRHSDRLEALSVELRDAERELAAAQEAVDVAQKRLRVLREDLLPSLLDEIGAISIRTKSGTQIELVEDVHISILQDRADEAFSWMEQNGFGGLVRQTLTVDLGKGSDGVAQTIEDALQTLIAAGAPVSYARERKVHPSTLKKFGRDSRADGLPLPPAFSIHARKVARVK